MLNKCKRLFLALPTAKMKGQTTLLSELHFIEALRKDNKKEKYLTLKEFQHKFGSKESSRNNRQRKGYLGKNNGKGKPCFKGLCQTKFACPEGKI